VVLEIVDSKLVDPLESLRREVMARAELRLPLVALLAVSLCILVVWSPPGRPDKADGSVGLPPPRRGLETVETDGYPSVEAEVSLRSRQLHESRPATATATLFSLAPTHPPPPRPLILS